MTAAQLNILLLALGALQGLFLFLLLYKKRKNLPGYFYLSLYLLVILLQITMKIASKLWLMETVRPLYDLSYFLPFLYGPLLWLFVKQTTRQPNSRTLIHFLPFLFLLFASFLREMPDAVVFVMRPLLTRRTSLVLELGSLLAYHAMAWRMLHRYQKDLSAHLHTLYQPKIRWLNQFIVGSLIVTVSIAFLICIMYYSFPRAQSLRFGFLTLTLFVYWISYRACTQPELFQVILGGAENASKFNRSIHAVQKYANSGLSKELLQQIARSLETKLTQDRLFLNEDLTIDNLALSIGCSKHHLSQALNEVIGRSFYDHINYYRVQTARELLSDPQQDEFKIASIAFDSGFNSISTFNEVFKRNTGLTPSQFRKQREENNFRKQRI